MIAMHAGTALLLVTLDRSTEAKRIDSTDKLAPWLKASMPSPRAIDSLPWTSVPFTMWTGPGGLRAPDWPLPALCPGAYWHN
jgi:hypothetical protein